MTEVEAAATAQTSDIEAWLDEATPDVVRVPICMNRALLSEMDGLTVKYQQYSSRPTGIAMLDKGPEDLELDAMIMRLAELQALVRQDEDKHTYIFQKGEYEGWQKILEKYPPTERQQEQFGRLIDHDGDAAAPEMVAFSCVHPKMTTEQAARLRQKLPEHVWGKLYDAAMQVNRTGIQIPLSVMRTVDQLATELKSTSPADTGSPSANSEVELPDLEKLSGPPMI